MYASIFSSISTLSRSASLMYMESLAKLPVPVSCQYFKVFIQYPNATHIPALKIHTAIIVPNYLIPLPSISMTVNLNMRVVS